MVILLTGGVGAGKSTVLNVLRNDYDAYVIQADEVAKEQYLPGTPGYNIAVSILGEDVIDTDLKLNYKRMADILYTNPRLMNKMDDAIHPMVWNEVYSRVRASKAKLIVVEAALLEEENSDIYDEIWYVNTSKATRIKRLKKNRGYDEQRISEIMSRQPEDMEFKAVADRIIDNNGSDADIKKQIDKILEGRV